MEAAIADGRVTPELERKQARALVAEYRCTRSTTREDADEQPIVIDADPVETGKVSKTRPPGEGGGAGRVGVSPGLYWPGALRWGRLMGEAGAGVAHGAEEGELGCQR